MRLWDLASGSASRTMRDHTGRVYGVAFSLDGQRLAFIGDGVVTIWDTGSGEEVMSRSVPG